MYPNAPPANPSGTVVNRLGTILQIQMNRFFCWVAPEIRLQAHSKSTPNPRSSKSARRFWIEVGIPFGFITAFHSYHGIARRLILERGTLFIREIGRPDKRSLRPTGNRVLW